MKNLILALSVLTLFAACGKSGSSNNDQPVNPGQGYAAVDLPPECGGPNQNAVPYEYQSAGCSPYSWGDNGHFRHGGCPRRMFAVCAAGVGMVCVPQDIYANNQVAWYNYQDGNRRMQFCGYEGSVNPGACSYRSIPGAGNIGRACLVGGVNECGYGRCVPLAMTQYRGDRRRNNRRPPRPSPRSQMRQIGICVQ